MGVTFSRSSRSCGSSTFDKPREFYVDHLGFAIDWEHRFSEGAPRYMQVSELRWCCTCPSTTATARPGSAVYVETRGVRAYQAELRVKEYPHLNPGVHVDEIGTCMTLLDPFGNTLRLNEPPPDGDG